MRFLRRKSHSILFFYFEFKANPHIRRVKCSFNATHLTTPEDIFKHMATCPDNQAVHDAISVGMSDFSWFRSSKRFNKKNSFRFTSDWGESTTKKTERQMASAIDGEDWDREAHVGHLFNEDELRQLNG